MLSIKKKIKVLIAYCLIGALLLGNFTFHAFADPDIKTRRTITFEYWATIKDYVKEHSTNVQNQYLSTHPITRLSEVDINGTLHIGAKRDGTYNTHEEKIYNDEVAEFLYSDDKILFSSIHKNFSKTYKEDNYKIAYLMVNGQRITPTEQNPDPVIGLSDSGVDIIELHYVEVEKEIISDVEFFDYNVTAPGTDTKPNNKNVNVTRKGMNTLSLTDGNTNRIVVGHPNVVNHMFTGIGVFSGQYVQPGIAKQFLNDGQIEFNVADPGLFTKEDIVINDRIAKKYIDDYKLGFSRSGNTYTLSTVYSSDNSAVLSNLEDVKISYKNANGTRKLYSNLFWPLDDYPDYEGKDPLFGKDEDSHYEGYFGFSTNDEEGLLGENIKHNWLLGMHYEIDFVLGDYIGPMDYYFRGDDDFWLYIDGELVKDVDLGGVHSSAGAYVDLREWMDERGMLDDQKKKHTMSVYFSERGGAGSYCYMSFTIPSNNEILNGKTSYSVKKIWDDNNNENRPKQISVVLINAESKEIMDSAILSAADAVSQSTWQYTFTDVPIYDINGKEILYQVIEEVTFDNYIIKYNSINKNESEIINTHIEPINIYVRKEWENDSLSERPESITVILKSEGREIARADLMEFPDKENTENIEYGSWSVTFKNLDSVNLNGKEIEYNVEELKNRNYISTIKNNGDFSYVITNSLREVLDDEYKELVVKKVWEDGSDYYGKRPESIWIQLKEKDTNTIVWEGEMSESFKKVSLAEEEAIEDEKIEEEPNIIATPSDAVKMATPANTTNATSSNAIKSASLKLSKIEEEFLFDDDGSFESEEFPGTIEDTQIVLSDNEKMKTKRLIPSETLPSRKEEVENESLTKKENADKATFDLVSNSDEGIEESEEVESDDTTIEDTDGSEETEDSTETEEPEETVEDNWTLEFIHVPIYNKDGIEIEYEITESDVPEGYIESYLNYDNTYFEVKNTLVKDIIGEKTWVDGGKGMNRPESITIVLFSDDDLIKKLQVSEYEEWKYEFKELPVFHADGTEITYIVREFPVQGYETSYDGYNICNTYAGYDAILPETGGKGIYLYWVLGIALIAGLCYEPEKIRKRKRK